MPLLTDSWLEERGLKENEDCGFTGKEDNSSKGSTSIYSYRLEELQEVGHCISNIHIRESGIPNAGRGAYSKSSHFKGDIIQVSPVLIHLKEEIISVSDETSVLINYCFSFSPSSSSKEENKEIALLPLSLMALANHNGSHANAEIEWYKELSL